MKVLAVITDPQQCRRMLLRLIKTGAAPRAGLYAAPRAGLYAAPRAGLYAAPPGLDASALN
jgi:hypothetical protein